MMHAATEVCILKIHDLSWSVIRDERRSEKSRGNLEFGVARVTLMLYQGDLLRDGTLKPPWVVGTGPWVPSPIGTDHQPGLVSVSPRTLLWAVSSHHGLLQRTLQSPSFGFSCLLLGDSGRSNHPGQPPAWGFWKRQDREKWQLLKICKTQSNFNYPPQEPNSLLKCWRYIYFLKNPHKLEYSQPYSTLKSFRSIEPPLG